MKMTCYSCIYAFFGAVFFISCKHQEILQTYCELRGSKNPDVLITSNGKQFARYSEYSVSKSSGTRHLVISEGSNKLATLHLDFDEQNRLVQILWLNVADDKGSPVKQLFEKNKSGIISECKIQESEKE